MRFTLAALALSAALSASAASHSFLVARQTLPNCAVPCIENANTAGCSATDDKCLCNSSAFISSTTTCIESACQGSDLQAAEASAQALCAAVGVTLTAVPTSSGSDTGSAPASSTDTSSSSSSTDKPAGTSTTAPATSPTSTSGSSTSAPASQTSTTSGASANAVGAVAGLVGLAMGVLAL